MTTTLKIGFVVDDTLDKPDGVQQYVLTVGEWLRRQGHEVHYLVGATQRTDIPHIHSLSRNVGVTFNGNKLTIPLPANGTRLKRLLVREQFDVLHVQMPYSPMLAQKIIRRAPSHTAIFGTFHILPQSRLVTVATHALGGWLRSNLRRFDQVFAVSPAAAKFATKAFRLRAVTVLPNVVDLAAFRTARQPARNGSDSDDVPIITFLGRLVPRKGCATLLEAVALLRKTHHQAFRVVICGKGPLADTLKQQAEDLDIADMVEFAGFVSEEDKPRYMAESTIMAFPSTGGESFGIVLIEAMAAGHPVVLAASNPGYASVLESKPSLLFAPGNAQQLADKLDHFLTDPAARKAVVDWQKGYVEQFDIAVVGQQLLQAYHTQIQKKLQKKL